MKSVNRARRTSRKQPGPGPVPARSGPGAHMRPDARAGGGQTAPVGMRASPAARAHPSRQGAGCVCHPGRASPPSESRDSDLGGSEDVPGPGWSGRGSLGPSDRSSPGRPGSEAGPARPSPGLPPEPAGPLRPPSPAPPPLGLSGWHPAGPGRLAPRLPPWAWGALGMRQSDPAGPPSPAPPPLLLLLRPSLTPLPPPPLPPACPPAAPRVRVPLAPCGADRTRRAAPFKLPPPRPGRATPAATRAPP